MQRQQVYYDILDAKGATGTGKSIPVGDYRNISIVIASANSANLTVKIQASISETAPDFTSAAALDNEWSYIQIKGFPSDTDVPGATGVAFAGADATTLYRVNVDDITYINATVTARSAGDVTVRIKATDNN